jgi:Flp pilus assembly protein TadB
MLKLTEQEFAQVFMQQELNAREDRKQSKPDELKRAKIRKEDALAEYHQARAQNVRAKTEREQAQKGEEKKGKTFTSEIFFLLLTFATVLVEAVAVISILNF